jgi:hypothetical protein
VIRYQYRHDRARRTLPGIDELLAKAECAVDGKAPIKRNRYIELSGATKSVNRTLQTKTPALDPRADHSVTGQLRTHHAGTHRPHKLSITTAEPSAPEKLI